MATTIKVNGVDRTVDVDGDTPLLWVLRDVLGMTGTKFGCGMALCGACTVHLDGVAVRSCITPIDSVGTSEITTIEAIGATAAGAKIQKAWLDREVVQCGYCQSGQIMSASALLASNPHPTDADIDDAMSGNICRCGTYVRIREAIKQAAQSNGQGGLTMILDQLAPRPADGERSLPARLPAGRSGRGRRPDAEPEPAVRERRSRSGRAPTASRPTPSSASAATGRSS